MSMPLLLTRISRPNRCADALTCFANQPVGWENTGCQGFCAAKNIHNRFFEIVRASLRD